MLSVDFSMCPLLVGGGIPIRRRALRPQIEQRCGTFGDRQDAPGVRSLARGYMDYAVVDVFPGETIALVWPQGGVNQQGGDVAEQKRISGLDRLLSAKAGADAGQCGVVCGEGNRCLESRKSAT